MSDIFSRVRDFRRLIHSQAATRADLLTFAILAFGFPDRDGCHPAEVTIAEWSRQDRKTVRAAVHHLNDLKAIRVTRRYAGRRVIGSVYEFGVEPGASAPVMEESAPRPLPTVMGESAPAIESSNISTGTGSGSDSVVNLEAEQIARRAQQASAAPGWRLDNARRAILRAIERSGLEAVRECIATLVGAGLRAYEISARLEALEALPSHCKEQSKSEFIKNSSPITEQETLPSIARRALSLLRMGSPTQVYEWYKRADAIGVNAKMYDFRAWVPAIAEAYIKAEHWREWCDQWCSAAA